MGDAARKDEELLRELRQDIAALTSVVSRFVVVLERQLASNDVAKRRAAKHVTGPSNEHRRAEIRRKIRRTP